MTFLAEDSRRIVFQLDQLASSSRRNVPDLTGDRAGFSACIRNLVRLLENAPTGKALLACAVANGLSVGIDPLLEPCSSFYYPSQNRIDLGYQAPALQRSEKGISRYLASLTAGLRRVWHDANGLGLDFTLAPADFLTHCRIIEADVEAVTQLTAWELRAGGTGFFWRYVMSGPCSDISAVFEDAGTARIGRHELCLLMKEAFNQWFSDRDRVNAADHLALEMIDLALLQNPPPLFGTLPLDLRRMQDAGLLPAGKNYLQGCQFTNPWYFGLDDVFNATHLRHIEQDIRQVIDK